MEFRTSEGGLQADGKPRTTKPEAVILLTKSANLSHEIGEIVAQNRRFCKTPDGRKENTRPLPEAYETALSSSICRNR
ncbi:hypothetical protein [Prevotella sp. KH2C16]|uniref:hypothetical protein n=1 Tax=Prevotella sp. KH2C16 TaxID=1855325 RepID=UPI0008F03EC1|nr:hypothetical protein [Prevotella sp. KH2C16]SFG45695.1 hypothetical protein SAMN05216383_11518 [Prevotella sp. KH2C16]